MNRYRAAGSWSIFLLVASYTFWSITEAGVVSWDLRICLYGISCCLRSLEGLLTPLNSTILKELFLFKWRKTLKYININVFSCESGGFIDTTKSDWSLAEVLNCVQKLFWLLVTCKSDLLVTSSAPLVSKLLTHRWEYADFGWLPCRAVAQLHFLLVAFISISRWFLITYY